MNRLYKSNKDKVFDGVCGGLGEYYNIDPVVVRLLWVVLVIFGGTGVLAYLVAMIIVPKSTDEISTETKSGDEGGAGTFSHRFWGILLIAAGLLLLLGFIGPLGGLFAGATLIMGSMIWPLLVIGLGLYLFFDHSEKANIKTTLNEAFPGGKKLYKSRTDRRIAGVCGGIGNYFNMDSNIIRIFWVMATLGSFGFGILGYLALTIFLTDTDNT